MIFNMPIQHIQPHVGTFDIVDLETCLKLVKELVGATDRETVEPQIRM